MSILRLLKRTRARTRERERQRNTPLWLVLGLLAVVPGSALAQDDDDNRTSVLRRGARSIVLPFPTTEGDANFGYWKMRSDRTNLGLLATINVQHFETDGDTAGAGPENSSINLRLGPAFKRYFDLHPSVAGYGLLGVQGTYSRISAENGTEQTQTGWGAQVQLGIGAEWFPFRRISLGGTTGLQGGFNTFSMENPLGDTDGSRWFLNTFTNAVEVQIYF